MPRLRRSTSVVAVLLIGQSVAWAGVGQAQGRPSGESSRFWAELGVSAAAQVHRCVSCTGSATLGGASATAAAGVTLPNGFGIGVLGRTFGALFDFDSARRSRYVIALAQYAPPAASMLTLNVGGGGGRHTSDSQVAPTDGSGAVVYAGAALRLPPRGGPRAECDGGRAAIDRRNASVAPAPDEHRTGTRRCYVSSRALGNIKGSDSLK